MTGDARAAWDAFYVDLSEEVLRLLRAAPPREETR